MQVHHIEVKESVQGRNNTIIFSTEAVKLLRSNLALQGIKTKILNCYELC